MGSAPLSVTFDRYYAADPRPFLALTVDLDALDVPWRYDAPGLAVPAHLRDDRPGARSSSVHAVARDDEGRFYSLSPF